MESRDAGVQGCRGYRRSSAVGGQRVQEVPRCRGQRCMGQTVQGVKWCRESRGTGSQGVQGMQGVKGCMG